MSFYSLRHSNAIAILVARRRRQDRRLEARTLEPGSLLFRTYSHFIRSADKAAAERLDAALS